MILLLAWQHINQWEFSNHPPCRFSHAGIQAITILKQHWERFYLKSSQEKRGGGLLGPFFVFGHKQEKNQFPLDNLIIHSGAWAVHYLPWNRDLPRDLRAHLTGEEVMLIISWANPKSLPISPFATSSLDMLAAAPALGPCWHSVGVCCVFIY